MKKIQVSISHNFEDETNMPRNSQLAIFKYQRWKDSKIEIINKIKFRDSIINVIHLPIDILKQPICEIFDMISLLKSITFCKKFVIHPNEGIRYFIRSFLNSYIDAELCIENFQHRKKKELRNILYIIEECIRYDTPRLRACFDTSHAEEHWFNPQILQYMLKYISVIHLSNRKGKRQHMPFNITNGDLRLVSFIQELKNNYNWSGDIVLEYMEEYTNKLTKNSEYLKRLLK